MIERYTLPAMGNLWTDRYKYQTWLEVEIAVCEAQAELGYIPGDAVEEIKAKANFDPDRILEIEAEVRHDVIAFLTNVNEYVGEPGRYIHLGLTSSDVLDTALSLQLVASLNLILEQLEDFIQALRYRAQEHRYTVMVGRSHGIHAEPITFGFKLAGWLAEVLRGRDRLIRLRQDITIGKISGAVGTYANIDPKIEALTCQKLGLEPDTASTQVISRDRHADYVQQLALLAASIERFAVEIRNLQRTDVLEVEEYFSKGQKGSSAMPHKRNPIRSERLTGMARIIRSHSVSALENIALWHERDISHSSVERVMLPDVCILTHFMLKEITDLVKNLLVYPENMKRNMNVYGGVIFSQRVLLRAWNTDNGNFKAFISQDEQVTAILSPDEIESCFDPQQHLNHLNSIYQRLDI
ncbi:MAG: adenylosuccinate lyase [Microcystis aeruginosa LL13-03]|nr:adenylosuccinate lyase [Microcystis aeruginosa LL13-03]